MNAHQLKWVVWVPTGYEPTVRAYWLDRHGLPDESREGTCNDAPKNAGGVRVHSTTLIRSNLHCEPDNDQYLHDGVPDHLGPANSGTRTGGSLPRGSGLLYISLPVSYRSPSAQTQGSEEGLPIEEEHNSTIVA